MGPSAPRTLAVLIPFVAGLAGVTAETSTAPRRLPVPTPRQLLGEAAQLNPLEAAKVEQGDVVVRVLGKTADHEVAVSGAVRIAAGREAFLELAADVPRFKQGPAILQLGLFGAVPSSGDLSSLTLDETEFAALRRCASGDCSSKLAALDLNGFRNFDWAARDASPRAEQLVRTGLAAHVRDYGTRGNAAMMRFERTRVPTSLAAEFQAVLTASSHAMDVAPELGAFFGEYKTQPVPAGGLEILYWARETFGMKPMLSAYHVVVHRPPARPDLGVVVSKQFYASRYIDASLEITIVADDPTADAGPGCYLIYVARSRVDSLRGLLGGLKRGAIERESREATTARLAGLRSQLARASSGEAP